MSRTTIDYGIDLGTTNSAIAVLKGTDIEVIKGYLGNDITASAVHIDKQGSIRVGMRAKERLRNGGTLEDVHTEFKRMMGTAEQFLFKTTGRTMKAEELSAEVLKSLRADALQRFGEEIQAAVITIPAAFEQRQCAATKVAGQLAGLNQCPLVQEPVAAALAYGFQRNVNKEHWLIYDFGGGTFDAAIMKAEDGIISVVNHGGDNYLGGTDIDWAVIEQLIIPELAANFDLPDFRRGNSRWKTALHRIRHTVEVAKIELSDTQKEFTYLEGCEIEVAKDQKIEVEFKLTKDDLVRLAEPIILRSIKICRQVLQEKNLSSGAMEKVILVGGPTKADYFREIVKTELKVSLDFSVDPMTVVAHGAAVFAGTQRIESKATRMRPVAQYEVDLKYSAIGVDEDPTVMGTVNPTWGGGVAGFTIEFVNQQNNWRSGKIPLKANGNFRVDLWAEKGLQNVFAIELLDARGTRQKIAPDSLTYTIGMAISEQPITNSIAIALASNERHIHFKKGESLPARARGEYRSTHSVRRGSADHVLYLPVIEGERSSADHNRLLGRLAIDGTQICRDLPAGSEIEVTSYFPSLGRLQIKAYIPFLDQEFENILYLNTESPDPALLQQEFESTLKRLETVRTKADEAGDDQVRELLENLEMGNELRPIKIAIDAAKADNAEANKAELRLIEIKQRIDQAENHLEWPLLVADANEAMHQFDEIIDEFGTTEQQNRAHDLRQQMQEAIEQKRAETLRRKLEQLHQLHRELLFEQDAFWLGLFEELAQRRDVMTDNAAADRFFSQGRQYIERENIQGLRHIIAQLFSLMPENEAEAIQRGYQSSLMR